jgi:hypothetical protein
MTNNAKPFKEKGDRLNKEHADVVKINVTIKVLLFSKTETNI